MLETGIQESPLGDAGCLWGEQEGVVTEEHVRKESRRLQSGRTEDKHNSAEAKVDVDKVDVDRRGSRLYSQLLLRDQAKLVLEKVHRGLGF